MCAYNEEKKEKNEKVIEKKENNKNKKKGKSEKFQLKKGMKILREEEKSYKNEMN